MNVLEGRGLPVVCLGACSLGCLRAGSTAPEEGDTPDRGPLPPGVSVSSPSPVRVTLGPRGQALLQAVGATAGDKAATSPALVF